TAPERQRIGVQQLAQIAQAGVGLIDRAGQLAARAKFPQLSLRRLEVGGDQAYPFGYLVPYSLGRRHHRGDFGERATHLAHRGQQRLLGLPARRQLALAERCDRLGQRDRRTVEQGSDLAEPGGGAPARYDEHLVGAVDDGRVRGEGVPQSGETGGRGVPGGPALAGERGAGEQPLAEAVVQVEQVRLDRVALSRGSSGRGQCLLASKRKRHRYSARRRERLHALPVAMSRVAIITPISRPPKAPLPDAALDLKTA